MKGMNQKTIWLTTAAVVGLGAFGAGQASAAGYLLKEQSGFLQGTSFAGAASRADDPSTMHYNAASLSRLNGLQITQSGAYIAPTAKFSSGSATRATVYGGSTISGPSSTGDVISDAVIGSTYISYELNKDWTVGMAVTVPWGLITNYDSTWIGRYHGLKSSMRTLNFNPMASYRVNEQFSVGGGLQLQRMSAHLTGGVDFGTVVGAPGAADGYSDIKGNDWGYGFNLGALWEPTKQTRVGISFTSAVAHDLEGSAMFTKVPAVAALRASFANTGAHARVTTPEILEASVYHELSSQWAVMAEASWTNWSRFKNLIITYDNPLRAATVTKESWKDGYFFALGTEYKATEQLAVRVGVAYDKAPTPNEERTPRIPDSDRIWGSLGATYKINEKYSVSAAYTHIWGKKAEVDLRDTGSTGNNNLRGNLRGAYDAHVDIVALQVSAKF